MTIEDLLDPAATAIRVSATNKRQALSALSEIAARTLGVKASVALDGLLAREAAGSTGVGSGVAVPHARLAGLDRVRAVFIRLEQPVAFDAIDGQAVDLVIGLFAPPEATSDHLRALARVSRLMRQPALREQLRAAPTADAVYALLGQDHRAAA
jgi:PTS system nitrogen regulatory IIA component